MSIGNIKITKAQMDRDIKRIYDTANNFKKNKEKYVLCFYLEENQLRLSGYDTSIKSEMDRYRINVSMMNNIIGSKINIAETTAQLYRNNKLSYPGFLTYIVKDTKRAIKNRKNKPTESSIIQNNSQNVKVNGKDYIVRLRNLLESYSIYYTNEELISLSKEKGTLELVLKGYGDSRYVPVESFFGKEFDLFKKLVLTLGMTFDSEVCFS